MAWSGEVKCNVVTYRVVYSYSYRGIDTWLDGVRCLVAECPMVGVF